MPRRRRSPVALPWLLRRLALGRTGRILGAIVAIAVAGGAVSMLRPGAAAPPAPAFRPIRVDHNHLVDGSGAAVQLRGVDLSGTEFSCIQGGSASSRGWSIYGGQPLDEPSTYAAIAAWHANVVRVPLNEDCWLGINGVSAGFGGATYRAAIQTEVSLIHKAGMYAMLDLHWSSPGAFAAYAQQPMADADHSVAFWASVASAYRGDPKVLFDLYNEPFFYYIAPGGPDPWTCWLRGCRMTQVVTGGQVNPDGSTSGYTTAFSWQSAGMQSLVDAVRGAGATQPVVVNGADWANDLSGWLAHQPTDPAGQLVAGWHSYPQQGCSARACWDSVIAPIAARVPVVVGETGDNVCGSVSYDDAFLPWADAHGVGYLGWTWNPWQNCDNVLVEDWAGTPSGNYGQFFHDHLIGAGT